MDNAEIMQQLYAPFPLDMHSIREGHRLSNGKRIQWFVYLDRAAIQRRLDELFPLDWSFHHVETHRTQHYATVTVAMTVHGCTRVFNGGQEPREKDGAVDQDTEKGAFTEAFRRVASLFGLGLYAYEGVRIVTDSYERGDWDRQRDLQAQAWKQFEDWYHKQFGGGLHPAFAPQSSQPSASQMLDTRSSNGNSKPAQQQDKERDNVSAEGQIAVVTNIIPRVSKKNNTYYDLITDSGKKVVAWSRDVFRDAWNVEEWTENNKSYALEPHAEIRYIEKPGTNGGRPSLQVNSDIPAVPVNVPF